MKLLADESVEGRIIARLRQDGHEVASVAEDSAGDDDEVVLARASREGVLLITADKDFGELVYRHRHTHAGIILLRIAGLNAVAKCNLVSTVLPDRGEELQGAFSVLSADSLRVRREPTD